MRRGDAIGIALRCRAEFWTQDFEARVRTEAASRRVAILEVLCGGLELGEVGRSSKAISLSHWAEPQ